MLAAAWTLVTTLGWAAGWSIYALVGQSLDLRESASVIVWPIAPAAGGGLTGLICGFGQYLVLRNRTGRTPSWVATVALSWSLCWPIATKGLTLGFAFGLLGARIPLATLPACGGGIAAGALAGWIQWRALNLRIELSGFWIFASMIGWSVGWATISLADLYLGSDGQIGFIAGGIISGAIIGASTGSLFLLSHRNL